MQSLAFLYRYRLLWVTTLLASVVFGLFVLAIFPRRFASEAKLIVKVGRESVSLDPTATSNQTVMLQKTQEEEINSALEVLSSQAIRDKVVADIGAENILDGYLPSESSGPASMFDGVRKQLQSMVGALSETLTDIGVRDRYSLEERAANEVMELIHISASKKSRVISIYSEAKSPEMAKLTAEKLVEYFQTAHSEISSTKGSYELFEDELARADKRLADSKQKMAGFMADNQIVSVESNQALLADTWKNIISEITTLEAERRSIASNLNQSHPRYQSLVAQLEMARNTVSWLKSTDTEDVLEVPNQTTSILENEVVGSDDSIKDDDLPVEAEANPYRPVAQKLQKLIRINNELDTLQRIVRKHELERAFSFQKFEEARIIREQRNRAISNIVLFQPATLNRKPVSPNKPITLVATVLGCFFLATTFACYREFRRPRDLISNAQRIQDIPNLNLVARIPRTRSATDRMNNQDSLKRLRTEVYGTIQSLLKQRVSNDRHTGILVGVQSCEKGSGASTFATILASAASKDFGLRTLLIDCDSNERAIASKFRLNGSAGLKEFLEQTSELNDCLNVFTPFGLDVMSSGVPRTQLRMSGLDPSALEERLEELRSIYELVIFDLPPDDVPTTIAARLGEQMDKILLVAEQNKTSFETLNRQTTALNHAGRGIWGVVLNKCRKEFPWQVQ